MTRLRLVAPVHSPAGQATTSPRSARQSASSRDSSATAQPSAFASGAVSPPERLARLAHPAGSARAGDRRTPGSISAAPPAELDVPAPVASPLGDSPSPPGEVRGPSGPGWSREHGQATRPAATGFLGGAPPRWRDARAASSARPASASAAASVAVGALTRFVPSASGVPAVSGGRAVPAPLRLTRRGRVVVVVVLLACLCVVFSLGRVTSSASTGAGARPTQVHVVKQGETLWTIAAGLAPRSDTRVVVARLAGLNKLSSTDVVPGQPIVLP